MTSAAERRPIPGWPDHTIDQEGHVHRKVSAHGRVFDCLVPVVDGVVSLVGERRATTVRVAQLMDDVWADLPDG